MTSLTQRIINRASARMPYKEQLGQNGDALWEWARTRRHTLGRARPRYWPYRIGCRVEDVRDSSVPYWEYTPRRGTADSRVILFFHGGSWMFRFSLLQATFVAWACRTTGICVRVPRYPLLPEADGPEFRRGLYLAWRDCLADGYRPDQVVLMGDSAGAHACLSLYQMLRMSGEDEPGRLILISSPMDFATPPDEETRALEAIDPVISLASTPTFAQKMGVDLPLDDPRVSPRLGCYDGCPPIDLFVGEYEVLKVASVYLAKTWGTHNPVRVHVGRGCMHDWPTFPTLEGRIARAAIADLLREN